MMIVLNKKKINFNYTEAVTPFTDWTEGLVCEIQADTRTDS